MREVIKDRTRLLHMLEAINNIQEFSSGVDFHSFIDNKLLKFSIFYNVGIIGEAAYKLSKEFITEHPQIPWRDIINMRHVIVHGYYQIDAELLWETVQNDIGVLKANILLFLEEDEKC